MSIAVENTTAATQWLFNKNFELHRCDCIQPKILVLVHQIHLISWCFICKHWNSIKFMHFFNVFDKKCYRYRDNFFQNLPWSHRYSAVIDISDIIWLLKNGEKQSALARQVKILQNLNQRPKMWKLIHTEKESNHLVKNIVQK